MAVPNIVQPMQRVELGCGSIRSPVSFSCVVLNSLFPSHQSPQYEFKDPAGNFTPSLTQPGAYYPFEPTLGQYQYDR